jgi:6-methylsalicylate decarboxylase
MTQNRIDVHAHAIPSPYQLALTKHGITEDSGAKIPSWTPAKAIDFMSRYGIAAQVISISEPGVNFLASLPDRMALSRDVNEYLATELLHATEPDLKGRFGAFGLLPLRDLRAPEIDAACTIATEAITTLGCDGIGMFSNYRGVYLGDPRLDPLYTTLNDLGAVVFLHSAKASVTPTSTLPAFLCEFPFDTTRGVASLGRGRVFDRYPRIKWVLAHAGGTLPYLAHRIATMSRYARIPGRTDDSGIRLNRLYYDTALSPAPASIDGVLAVAPLTHLLFGSDWPFSEQIFLVPGDPAPQLDERLTAAQRSSVDRNNALSLLPGLAGRVAP